MFPLRETYWSVTFKNNIITPLKEHDKISSSKLMPTALAYIENRGELKKTADKLNQHVNTIRYRINRIKEIIDYNDDNNYFYEQLFIAITLYNYI